jgi:ethanolamine transporter EutH
MMKMLSSRLLNAALIVSAVVLAPHAAFAQDAAMADNSSSWIGGLVVWLLPIGGIFAVVVATAMDKGAQSSRTARR